MIMRAPVRIKTPRLVLRAWVQEDVPLLREALHASADELGKWTPWVLPDPANPNALDERIAGFRAKFDTGEMFGYGVFDNADRLVGGAGLFARIGPDALEIGYWTHSAAAGRGYATEVARALNAAAFEECGVARVEIHCEPGNVASAAIPRRLGFRLRETIQAEARIAGNPPVELLIFEMIEAEYRQLKSLEASA
jgi:RimJ/RimL family protein N-acetyltransferase